MFKAINLRKLFISIIFIEVVWVLSYLISQSGIAVYLGLVKPDYSLSLYIINIVWSILFVLMGVSWYLIKSSSVPADKRNGACRWFWLQLIFVFVWPILFFNIKIHGFSALWLIGLIFLIAVTVKKFSAISKTSAHLLIPYLAWSVYMLYLNYGIWMLNK